MKKEKIKRYGKFTFFSQFFTWEDFFRGIFRRGEIFSETYHLIREFKFFKQRWFRGWDDTETWNLDREFSEFLYPRLKRYFEATITGAPYRTIYNKKGEIKKQYQLSEEEWEIIKNKILRAMELSRIGHKDFHLTEEEEKEVSDGWNLFHEFRRSFWW